MQPLHISGMKVIVLHLHHYICTFGDFQFYLLQTLNPMLLKTNHLNEISVYLGIVVLVLQRHVQEYCSKKDFV